MSLETAHPISISKGKDLKVPEIDFKYSITLDVSLNSLHKLVKAILAHFGQDENKVYIINHITWSDHSESYIAGHYGSYGQEKLLLKIEDRWIDPHFLAFWLWETENTRSYDIDNLFREQIFDEASQSGHKFGELLISPCKIIINTVESDPKIFLPNEEILKKMTIEAVNSPDVRFWQSFQAQKFDDAALFAKQMRKQWTKKDTQYDFLNALEALCYFNDAKYEEAVQYFVRIARDFDSKSLTSYSNLCLFFSIEAAKRMKFPTQSISAMEKIANKIPQLSNYRRREISGVLKVYSVSVYVGVVVLCRRIIEIALKDTLTQRYGGTVANLVAQCKQAGVLEGRQGESLGATLHVAKWKKVISPIDFDIAMAIKDYGNRIHVRNGIRNAVHAKYAIQACIRILRQLESGQVSSNPKFFYTSDEHDDSN